MSGDLTSKPVLVNDMSRFVIVELPGPATHEERKQIAQRIASALERSAVPPPAQSSNERTSKWTVMGICHAYESGFADGIDGKASRNVRPESSPEHEAYDIGHKWGVGRQALLPPPPSADPLPHDAPDPIRVLLDLVEGKCPACGGDDLHSALVDGSDGVSCCECPWGISYANLRSDALRSIRSPSVTKSAVCEPCRATNADDCYFAEDPPANCAYKPAVETSATRRCPECYGDGRITVLRIGNEVNIPCPECEGRGELSE